MRVFSLQMLLGLACAAWLASCASVTIAPGHRGVRLDPDGTISIVGEGITAVAADVRVDDFDLRQRAQTDTFSAITSDGVRITVVDPVVDWALAPDALAALDRTVGADAWSAVVKPVIRSTGAAVLATYRWDQLDAPHIREAQLRITAAGAARLRPYHVVLSAVELKAVVPALPETSRAVVETSVWMQRSAAALTQIQLAKQQADQLRAQAAGIADANRRLAPTLSASVLQQRADNAWLRLITSPHTAVELSDASTSTIEVVP